MKIFIAGAGKLAQALINANLSFPGCQVFPWTSNEAFSDEPAVVIHAGSGRQLPECIAQCEKTNSVLIELSTGLATETMTPSFPLIICPNTSILLLKSIHMLQLSGRSFKDYKISILESHQTSKTSEPGTAFSFANALDVPTEQIISIRNPATQQTKLGIPQEYLDRHAYHKIIIEDGHDQLTIETRVLGHQSYADGVRKIVQAVLHNKFDKKRYSILELIDEHML